MIIYFLSRLSWCSEYDILKGSEGSSTSDLGWLFNVIYISCLICKKLHIDKFILYIILCIVYFSYHGISIYEILLIIINKFLTLYIILYVNIIPYYSLSFMLYFNDMSYGSTFCPSLYNTINTDIKVHIVYIWLHRKKEK